MIKILGELSQILAVARISASQEEQILIPVKNLSSSPEVIEEQQIHEPHPHEDIHPFHLVEEIKESWTTSNGEKPLEHEIEEFLTCLSPNPLSTQVDSHHVIEGLHGMVKEDMPN